MENPQIIERDTLTDHDFKKIYKIRYDLWNLERRFALMQISKIFININHIQLNILILDII